MMYNAQVYLVKVVTPCNWEMLTLNSK